MKSTEIVIYEFDQIQSKIKVLVSDETVWLTQGQMVQMFEKTKQNISLHIKNCFKENELDKDLVVKEYLTTALDKKQYKTKYYNLDVIISVGYRIKSQRGTQFRIWATNVLKDHILKGYTVNRNRLSQLQQSVKLIQTTVGSELLQSNEIKEVVDVLTEFALGLDILDGYDHQNLNIESTIRNAKYKIKYEEAKTAIDKLKSKFGGSNLFGNEKDDSFKSSIATIDQTFDGKDLYPSIEEKSANLLYFVVKNHSFTDGNKSQ